MKALGKFLAVATGIVGLVSSAHAVPTLYLSDGTVSITVADGSALDSDSREGIVSYVGALGANWTMNVSEGITKPALGSVTNPKMQLVSADTTSKGAGTLTLMFSDDGFGPVSGTLINSFGGTTVGNVSGQTFADGGNVLFALTTPLTSGGPYPGTSYNGTQTAQLSMVGPFSLTEVMTIIHSSKGWTSVGQELTVPDAGLTFVLLGSALLGLAVFGRVQKKAQA